MTRWGIIPRGAVLQPFMSYINVGTNKENIIENFACFIEGGAGPLHLLRL